MAPAEITPEGYLDGFEHMNNYICDNHCSLWEANVQNDDSDNEDDDGGYKMRPVWKWSEIKPGKFCYIKYLGFWHAVLITEKFPDQRNIKAIHFAWPSLFSRRVIQEDTFTVNLGKNELWEVHIPRARRVPLNTALERARGKIGQRGFNMLWRRSSHIIRECVEA